MFFFSIKLLLINGWYKAPRKDTGINKKHRRNIFKKTKKMLEKNGTKRQKSEQIENNKEDIKQHGINKRRELKNKRK